MKKMYNTLAIAAFVAVSSFFAQKANAQTTMSIASAQEIPELIIIDEETDEDDGFFTEEETEISNDENKALLWLQRHCSVDVDNTQNNQNYKNKKDLTDDNTVLPYSVIL